MSPEKSQDIKGKAVVNEEEPSLPLLADAPSPPVADEQEIWLLKKVKEVPAPAPANIPGSHQHGDSRILFIKRMIKRCVAALDAGNVAAANAALHSISSVATATGDPFQRVAFAFAEALASRAMQLVPGLVWALQLQVLQPLTTPVTANAARQSFAALCPLVRVAATAANHAILDAMAAERHVHVVDLGGANPNQWLELVRLFAARPGGSPSLRLTVVNEQDDFLSRAARLLTQEAVCLHVKFVLNPVRSHIDRFSPPGVAALGIIRRQGEALAITSTLQLHRLIADEVTITLPAVAHINNTTAATTSHNITKADALLRVLGDLMPKLMVLTEQEADHNGEALSDRVPKAFDYYAMLFRDLEVGAGDPRGLVDRVAVERVLLRDEVMDIVACDGVLRRERHEKIVRWVLRMTAAGFEPAQVSANAFKETARLAHQLSSNGSRQRMYEAHKVNKGCIFLSACKIPVFSVSAWRPVQSTSK